MHTLQVDLRDRTGSTVLGPSQISEPAECHSLRWGTHVLHSHTGHASPAVKPTLGVATNPRKARLRSPWGSFLPPYLDDKVHVALVLVTGDGSVWPDDQAAVNSGREVDVFAWRPCRDLRKSCLRTCCIPVTFQKPQGCWREQGHLASHCCPNEPSDRDDSPLSPLTDCPSPWRTLIGYRPDLGGSSRGAEGLGNG